MWRWPIPSLQLCYTLNMEKINPSEVDPQKTSLRKAEETDQRFLFGVVRSAMQPVYEASGQVVKSDDEAFVEFQEKFDANDVSVIQYEGKDVGRLRVVRTLDNIFVGGIHLLPEYQGLGIGSSVLTTLIEESKLTATPIVLEVRDVNLKATALYEKLGFVEQHQRDNMIIMEYKPSTENGASQ